MDISNKSLFTELGCPLYFVGFVALLENMRTPFYPPFAAMTFPFVIAATATAKFAAFSQVVPIAIAADVQLAIAAIATFYVLVRYGFFLGKR